MEYFILNEESTPFPNKETANKYFPDFLFIVDLAFAKGFTLIRTTGDFDSGWFEFPLADNYVLREWLVTQDQEFKTRVKSIISKTHTPLVPEDNEKINLTFELSEFSLVDNFEIKVPSLGVAYLLDQLAISFCSDNIWNAEFVNVEHYQLDENAEAIEVQVKVKNVTNRRHWEFHYLQIEKERKENIKHGKNLWEKREELFPSLSFCGKTEGQLKNFNFSSAVKNKIWHVLKILENFCSLSAPEFNELNLKGTGLNFSEESDSVKNNKKLRSMREFRLPDGTKEYFKWHIKNIPGTRMYFQFDFEYEQIYIGYIGNHLPTSNF